MHTTHEPDILYAPGTVGKGAPRGAMPRFVPWVDPVSGQQFKWQSFPVPYYVAPGTPPFVVKAFTDALAAWRAVAPKVFSFTKSRPVVPTDNNPAITLYYDRAGWLGGENSLAITGPATVPGTGQMVKAFIHVNAFNFGWHNGDPWWVSATKKKEPQADIYRVLLHELGHCLGLWHNDADPLSVMYPYLHPEENKISPDDVAGLRSIYGF